MGANCDDDLSLSVYSVAGAPTKELRLSKHVYDYLHPGVELDTDRYELKRRAGILHVPFKHTFEREFLPRVISVCEAESDDKSTSTNGDTHLRGEYFKHMRTRYTQQVGLPRRTFFWDSDDDEDASDEDDPWYKKDDYGDVYDSSDDDDYGEEQLDDDGEDFDPAGIMMDSPDLRLVLENLGEDELQWIGAGDVLETLLIPTQAITEDMATNLLGEDRFHRVRMVKKAQAELMFRSANDVGDIFFDIDGDQYTEFMYRKKVGRRLTRAAGYIRNQGGCCICWCFASSDLVSASLVLHGWESEYKSLSPIYLCQQVAPAKFRGREGQGEEEGIIHFCYPHNMEAALMYIKKHGIPKEEWDSDETCDSMRVVDVNEERFFITRVFRYPTLVEALRRLKTHPVGASLAMYTGWENRDEVYRGPSRDDSVFDGNHEVIMLHCRKMNGQMVVKCKSSTGEDIGYNGYIFVSLEVMWIRVGSRRREGEISDICPIRPQHLLSNFYSIDMDTCHNAPFKERPELAKRNLQFEINEEEESESESSHSSESGCRVRQRPNSLEIASSSTASSSEPVRPPQREPQQNKKKGVSICSSQKSNQGYPMFQTIEIKHTEVILMKRLMLTSCTHMIDSETRTHIEILCQTPELDELAIVVAVMKMLDATDANESPLEEAQECLGQSLGLEVAEEEEGKEEVEEEAEAETKT